MPIKNEEAWKLYKENNQDAYGGACVKVAGKVMEYLDVEPGDFDPHDLICRADKESECGGITGFMAGAAAAMVSACHSRGEEFRKKWNELHGLKPEHDNGGVINPAIFTISEK